MRPLFPNLQDGQLRWLAAGQGRPMANGAHACGELLFRSHSPRKQIIGIDVDGWATMGQPWGNNNRTISLDKVTICAAGPPLSWLPLSQLMQTPLFGRGCALLCAVCDGRTMFHVKHTPSWPIMALMMMPIAQELT